MRLVIRYRRRKLWWDDFWVTIAAICAIVLMVANYAHYDNPGTTIGYFSESDHSLPQGTKVAVYYLCLQLYYAVTWTSRLSILCTVIRIASGPRMRCFLHISAYLFIISWIVLAAQVFWICIPQQSWKILPIPQCVQGSQAAIALSISTDAILVYAPIQLILNAKLPPGVKLRLIVIFAATLVTTAASLYYVYALLRVHGTTEDFSATIHDGLTLLVANLSVITSFLTGAHSRSAPPEQRSPTIWPSARRTPARSFGFLSTTLSPEQVPTPSHVHFHVEVERDYQSKSDPALDNVADQDGPFGKAGRTKDASELPIPEVIELRGMPKNASPDELKAKLEP
ncbi:hypothetical protein BC629DRAFT_1435710 [Irpex lacteus]|nr:hypothetical protein BC629DRAFT_1435710 [Irpex lacteus]